MEEYPDQEMINAPNCRENAHQMKERANGLSGMRLNPAKGPSAKALHTPEDNLNDFHRDLQDCLLPHA
jgi:hypothetical protein